MKKIWWSEIWKCLHLYNCEQRIRCPLLKGKKMTLKRRHTDFQTVGRYISACLVYGYMRFFGVKTKSRLTVD